MIGKEEVRKIPMIDIFVSNDDKVRKLVAGHKCESLSYDTDYGKEYDCDYYPDFECDDCVFVVGYETGDYRKGKRPWRKHK